MPNPGFRGEGIPLPATKEKWWWKVVAPIGHLPLAVTFLGRSFNGFTVHYVEEFNKNVPCSESAACFMCRRGKQPRWCGYAPCYSTNHRAEKIVALTEGAAHQLLDTLERYGSLRGVQAVLQRVPPHDGKRKKNDPVKVTIKGRVDGEKLPAAFDVLPSLEKMWGCNLAFFETNSPEWAKLGQAPGEVEMDRPAFGT